MIQFKPTRNIDLIEAVGNHPDIIAGSNNGDGYDYKPECRYFEVESSTGVAQYADRLFLSATTDGINWGREQMIEQNEPFVYDKRVLWKKVGRIRKNIGFKLRVITKSPVTLSGCQIRIE
jgi:hypothetical protein